MLTSGAPESSSCSATGRAGSVFGCMAQRISASAAPILTATSVPIV
jgi:hypothetical protein